MKSANFLYWKKKSNWITMWFKRTNADEKHFILMQKTKVTMGCITDFTDSVATARNNKQEIMFNVLSQRLTGHPAGNQMPLVAAVHQFARDTVDLDHPQAEQHFPTIHCWNRLEAKWAWISWLADSKYWKVCWNCKNFLPLKNAGGLHRNLWLIKDVIKDSTKSIKQTSHLRLTSN